MSCQIPQQKEQQFNFSNTNTQNHYNSKNMSFWVFELQLLWVSWFPKRKQKGLFGWRENPLQQKVIYPKTTQIPQRWNEKLETVSSTVGGVGVEGGECVGRLVDRRAKRAEILPPEAGIREGIGGDGDRD